MSLYLTPLPSTSDLQISLGNLDSLSISSGSYATTTSRWTTRKSTLASVLKTRAPSTTKTRKQCLFVSTPLVDETQPRITHLLRSNFVSLDVKHHFLLRIPMKTTPSEPTFSTCKSTCLTPLNMSSPPSISFSPSSASSPLYTDLACLCSTPVYPCLLPASITLTLYIAAITNAPTLYAIEKLPLYKSDIISQELIRLLLDTFHF